LLIVAILITLGGTMISLNKLNQFEITGMATGTVNLTLGQLAQCNVDTNVSFGTGKPTGYLVLSTAGDFGGNASNFNNCSTSGSPCYNGMQINNTGNANLYVNFTSDKNASSLLGDNSNWSSFVYEVKNGTYKASTSQGCRGTLGTGGIVNNTATMAICTNLSYINTVDIVSLGFNVTINESTPLSSKQALITIACGAAG
jgi:hypothetical protein